LFQLVGGISATKLSRTIDLMPLKPYFQGTTKRKGAPILVWQILVVETDRQDGERVYGFVETQALDIRPA
jgi:hypothetical protein